MTTMANEIIFLKKIKESEEKGIERDRSTVLKGLIGMSIWEGKV